MASENRVLDCLSKSAWLGTAEVTVKSGICRTETRATLRILAAKGWVKKLSVGGAGTQKEFGYSHGFLWKKCK